MNTPRLRWGGSRVREPPGRHPPRHTPHTTHLLRRNRYRSPYSDDITVLLRAARRLRAQEEQHALPITQWTRDSEAPNQRVLTLELQVGRRALERLLDSHLGRFAETVALNAASAGRGV